MKRCPTCQSTYTDDSLRFCLQDGAQLVRAGEAPSRRFDPDATLREDFVERDDQPPPTEILDARIAPTARIASPAPTEVVNRRATRHGPPQNIAPAPESSGTAIKAALITLAAVLLMVAGLSLWLWLRSSGQSNRNAAASENDRRAGNENGEAYSKGNGATSAPPGKITATASSTRPPLAGNTYEAANALDGRLMTAWVEGVSGPGLGEWIRCDFEREVTLKRVSIAPGYFKSPQIWARNNRVSAATLYFSDGTSRRFGFDDRMEEQPLEVGAIRTSWVRIVINDVYPGTDPDTAISQLAFEWE